MVKVRIFVEGATRGPDSKNLQVALREAFAKLLIEGRSSRSPKFIPAGSRGNAYKLFNTAHAYSDAGEFVALLVDSEEAVADIEKTWLHLKARDGWNKPKGANDEQVLLMTTCMETWIVSDRDALRKYYGSTLQENALPPLHDMESRTRHTIQDALAHATRDCKNAFEKGKHSFAVLKQLRPAELRKHLPSFVRCERVLKAQLS
ncbi:MAG: DUF4276 family protein [Planctomycetaceae bacterium]